MQDNLENPFWRYSLAHYARPEVAACCLDYQNRLGANVNLLLFCCWLGVRGIRLDKEMIEQAALKIESWDRQVVQQLRTIRRYLKSMPASSEAVIHKLQEVELMTEQIVQLSPFEWWLEKVNPQNLDVVPDTSVTLQVFNLNTYLSLLGCEPIAGDSPLLWPVGCAPTVD